MSTEKIEVSTFFRDNLCVTGSEQASSHIGTLALDYGLNYSSKNVGTRLLYAPFTFKIKYLDPKYNSIYAESVYKCKFPGSATPDYLSFSFGHLKDISKYRVGQVINQGEFVGEDWYTGLYDSNGNPLTNQVHVHVRFGRGKLGSKIVVKVDPNKFLYVLDCEETLHQYDAFYVPKDIPINTPSSNPAYTYPWVLLPDNINENTTESSSTDELREKINLLDARISNLEDTLTSIASTINNQLKEGN